MDVVDGIDDIPGSLPGSCVVAGRLSASARADRKNDMVALFDKVDARDVDVEAKAFLPLGAGSSMEADGSAAGSSAATSSAMPLAGRGKL